MQKLKVVPFFLFLGCLLVPVKCDLWNFRAVGEFLSTDATDCSNFSVSHTSYFEETYYSEGDIVNKTMFRVRDPMVQDFSFFGDFKRDNVYTQLGPNCFENTDNGEVIEHFNPNKFGSEAVYAPIYIILTEMRSRMSENGELMTERGVSAMKFKINLTESGDSQSRVQEAFIIMRASDDEDEVIDYTNEIPLAIQTCVNNNDTITVERFTIIDFAWNTTNEEQTSPPKGIQCPGYGATELPEVFNASTLVLKMEQVRDEVNRSVVTTSDVILDFDRMLLRINEGAEWTESQTSYFLSTTQGSIYNVSGLNSRSETCHFYDLNSAKKFPWTFVDFKAKSVRDFFGVNGNFTVKSKSHRRGIECDVVSGVRTDYPPGETDSTSVWEWCVGQIDTAQGIKKYLVHLDIYVGEQLTHESYSLYDVESPDQKELYHKYFTTLTSCFDENQKMKLQLVVDSAQNSTGSDVETAVESAQFQASILNALLEASRMPPDAYRFGETDAIIYKTGGVFRFYILGAEPSGESISEIRKRLEDAVNTLNLQFKVDDVTFVIRKDSLTDANEPIVIPTVPTTIATEATTQPITSASTEEPTTASNSQSTNSDVTTASIGSTGSDIITTETTQAATTQEIPTTQKDDGETTRITTETYIPTTESHDEVPVVDYKHSMGTLVGTAFGLFIVGAAIGGFVAMKLLPA